MKKILLSLLQIGVSVFALWFVFHDPVKRHAMAIAIANADKGWILATLVAAGVSPAAAVIRWNVLLRVQEVTLGWMRVTQLYMIGAFFNLFFLGSTGGDVIKVFYLLREPAVRERRAGALLAVFMDRLVGLFALIIMSSIFVLLRYRWLTTTTESSALLTTFGIIMSSAVMGLLCAFAIISFRLTDRLPAHLPGRAKLIELIVACQVYARAWRATVTGICISFVGHSSFFFTYYFAAKAVHAKVSLWDMSVLLPIINTIISLPISVSGLGLRENLFNKLLGGLCHIGPEQAVPISIIGSFASVLFYGLLGGVFYFSYRSATGAPAAPVAPAEVEKLEAGLDRQVAKDVLAPGVADA